MTPLKHLTPELVSAGSPPVSVMMDAVDANMAAKADETFCLDTSKVICRHCTEAYQ